MITFFLVGFDLIAAQIWNDWNSLLIDTFVDSTVFGGGADSFTDLLWDQLDFGDAIASASTSIFDSWLTGVDFDAWLSSTSSKLGNLHKSADITPGMSTSEMIAQIKGTGFDSSELGWDKNVDLQTMLDDLHTLATYMEVLSYTEDMDISAFPHLGELESVLSDFGYPSLYRMNDIYEFLNTEVASEIPDSFRSYQIWLGGIEDGFAEIISDEDGAPSVEEVLSEMKPLIKELHSEVANGETSLSDALENLNIAYKALDMYTKDSAETLLNTSEVLLALFDVTNFDYNNLDSDLGKNWLIKFVSAMQAINDEYEVCPNNYIRDIMMDQYTFFEMLEYCPLLWVGSEPGCECLNNAGIYEEEDKKDVLMSMNCLFQKGDDLTVEQTLRLCNGEVFEVNEQDKIVDALETLETLMDLLTGDNYGSSLILYVAADQVTKNFQEIIDDIEDLSNFEIITDGTDGDYLDSVSGYIDIFDNLLSDLNFDGSFADKGEKISEALDQAFGEVTHEVSSEDEEPQKTRKSGRVGKRVWIIVVFCVLILFCGMCCCYVKRRNAALKKTIALESEIESCSGDLPEVYEEEAGTAETNGEPEMICLR